MLLLSNNHPSYKYTISHLFHSSRRLLLPLLSLNNTMLLHLLLAGRHCTHNIIPKKVYIRCAGIKVLSGAKVKQHGHHESKNFRKVNAQCEIEKYIVHL